MQTRCYYDTGAALFIFARYDATLCQEYRLYLIGRDFLGFVLKAPYLLIEQKFKSTQLDGKNMVIGRVIEMLTKDFLYMSIALVAL